MTQVQPFSAGCVQENNPRRYVTPDGRILESGTSVLKRVAPAFDAEGTARRMAMRQMHAAGGVVTVDDLEQAEAFKASKLEEWEENRDAAAAYGSTMHGIIEQFLNGDALPVISGAEETQRRQRQCWKAIHELPELYQQNAMRLSETIVAAPEYGVAGQADIVVVKDGTFFIADFKTSKRMRGRTLSMRLFNAPFNQLGLADCERDKYMFQMALYGWMIMQRTKDRASGPLQPAGAAIIWLKPDGENVERIDFDQGEYVQLIQFIDESVDDWAPTTPAVNPVQLAEGVAVVDGEVCVETVWTDELSGMLQAWTSAERLATFQNALIAAVNEGHVNPLQMFAACKNLKKVLEKVIDATEEGAEREFQKHIAGSPVKEAVVYGSRIKRKVTTTYPKERFAHHPDYGPAAKVVAELEKALKAGPVTYAALDVETGEVQERIIDQARPNVSESLTVETLVLR